MRKNPQIIDPKDSTCFIGLPGSGKTILTTYLYALPALRAGAKVVSDYFINWNEGNLTYFNPEEFDEKCLTWRNCLVCLDEIGVILDSRQYQEEGSNTRRFFSYHRKNHVQLICSTQHVSLVAKTGRNIISSWKSCEQTFDNPFIKFFLNLFGFKGIVIKTQTCSLNELADDKGNKTIEAPLLFGDYRDAKTHWLSSHKLISKELDAFKVELEHLGCLHCNTRMTELDRVDSDNFKTCPLCFGPIVKLKSIMYDTDYQLPEKKLTDVRTIVQKKVSVWQTVR